MSLGECAGIILHNRSIPGTDWAGLAGKVHAIALCNTLCFYTTHKHLCVCVRLDERGVTQYKQQTVTFECADCPLVSSTQVTCTRWKKMTL